MNYFKRVPLVIFVILINNSVLLCQKLTRAQYIEQFKEFAIKEMKEFGIPASITLAQACLESADGNSRLAILGNNHFGIKCSNWSGDTLLHHDDKKSECFRKYKSASESFVDHSLFLATKDRYSGLFKLDKADYKSWAFGLKSAGYATNPQYAEQLIKIIEDFSLYQYDKENNSDITDNKYSDQIATVYKDTTKSIKEDKSYDFSIARTVLSINKTKYIIAGGNDSYEDLAREFGLFKKEILNFNDLKEEEAISPGTIVYIEKKRKKNYGKEKFYVLEENDTYYSVSQKFGIRLKYLLKLNSLDENSASKEGKNIKLK